MPIVAETRLVAKALLICDGKMLALKRSATDTRRPLKWDLPGGAVELGEDIKAACVREVSEETGIMIEVKDCKTVYAMTEYVQPTISATFVFFIAVVHSAPVVLSNEHIEAQWMTLDEALNAFTYERHSTVLKFVVEGDLLHASASD